MATLRDIKRRIKSVKSTQQVTKAMKMVSAAKLRRAHQEILAARPYADKIGELVSVLSSVVKPDAHPLLSRAGRAKKAEEILVARPYADRIGGLVSALSSIVKPALPPLLSKAGGAKKAEVILLVSDRGLCGGFNVTLLRTAERFIHEHPDLEISLNIVGRRAMEHFEHRGLPLTGERPMGMGRPGYELARAIALGSMDGYLKGSSDEVYVIFSEFVSALTQKPTVMRLLPIVAASASEGEGAEKVETSVTGEKTGKIEKDEHAGGAGFVEEVEEIEEEEEAEEKEEKSEEPYEEALFEPSREELLARLLPKYVEVQVLRALLETAASEHGARMTAMDSASRNAADMIDYLTLLFNRARQAAITKELMEIIGGAEALK